MYASAVYEHADNLYYLHDTSTDYMANFSEWASILFTRVNNLKPVPSETLNIADQHMSVGEHGDRTAGLVAVPVGSGRHFTELFMRFSSANGSSCSSMYLTLFAVILFHGQVIKTSRGNAGSVVRQRLRRCRTTEPALSAWVAIVRTLLFDYFLRTLHRSTRNDPSGCNLAPSTDSALFPHRQ